MGTWVEIIERADELPPLAAEWNALARRFATPVLSFEWLYACAAVTSPPARLAIVVLRSGSEIRAIAPFAMTQRHGLATLEFVGEPLCRINEPCDFLYADKQSLNQLLAYVTAMRLPLRLDRVPVKSLTTSVLKQLPNNMISTPQRATQAPVLPVGGDWDDFVASWPKNRRRSVKRVIAAAESLGPVRFEIAEPTVESTARYFRTFLDIEASGWKGRERTAVAMNPYALRFWRTYCESLARQGSLRVSTLTINGVPAAVQLGAEYSNRFWAFKIGHLEQYDRASPGFLLTHNTIRYTFERQLEAYEFMGVSLPWKLRWTNIAHDHLSFRFYPRSLKGLFSLGINAARHAVSRYKPLASRGSSSKTASEGS